MLDKEDQEWPVPAARALVAKRQCAQTWHICGGWFRILFLCTAKEVKQCIGRDARCRLTEARHREQITRPAVASRSLQGLIIPSRGFGWDTCRSEDNGRLSGPVHESSRTI